jgi:hypothetical protein
MNIEQLRSQILLDIEKLKAPLTTASEYIQDLWYYIESYTHNHPATSFDIVCKHVAKRLVRRNECSDKEFYRYRDFVRRALDTPRRDGNPDFYKLVDAFISFEEWRWICEDMAIESVKNMDEETLKKIHNDRE